MNNLYVISGMTGMTGSELAEQIILQARGDVIGFDNFFCSSEASIAGIRQNPHLHFFKYDLNNAAQMAEIAALVLREKQNYDKVYYINCAAVVHTEYFYRVNTTFETNVNGMRSFLQQAILVGADAYINCSTSEVYSMQSFAEARRCRAQSAHQLRLRQAHDGIFHEGCRRCRTDPRLLDPFCKCLLEK